jgi:hypothetical protein
MRLKCRNLLVGVIIVNSQLEIVGTGDKPVLARNESNASDRDFCDLKRFDDYARFMVIDIGCAIVQPHKNPGLRWVEIDTLHSVGS